MIELTKRDNHKYIFEQCYKLTMSNENYFPVCEMLWLAEFMIDNFGQSYWHHEYIKIDTSDEGSFLIACVKLGKSTINLKIHPNWEVVSVQWMRDGEIINSIDRLDFTVSSDESEIILAVFLANVWKKEEQEME